MTDPEFADATYIEPLLPGPVAQVIERERPDALLGTLGGQTALNLAKALHDDGTLERFGVELIGANYEAIACAEDRELFGEAMARRRAAHAQERDRHEPAAGARGGRGARPAVRRAPGLHARRARRRDRAHARGLRADRRRGHRGLADRPGAARRVGDRLGRVRARGDARPRRQRRDRLLDRERRPDGRAHRRLGHRRAAADAHRPPLPAAARPGDRRDPRRRRRDGRLQRAVRRQSRDRGDPRDRDEPARLALLGAGLQGDRLPDRQDRRAPGRRLSARGDRQRHHRRHARVLRADDRLRRRQVAALRLREVPRLRLHADHAHEVRRRGDGDRAHLPAGLRQGAALARARQAAAAAQTSATTSCSRAWRFPAPTATRSCSSCSRAASSIEAVHEPTRIDPWFLRRAARARARSRGAVRRRALVHVGRHVRRRVPRAHALLLLRLGAPEPGGRSTRCAATATRTAGPSAPRS